ncbi:RagB/SusD family nutrient uptake outer membrane protein [Seonamhaeicola sediminis]|uniref:RagB/SusD family nutrient uptake outer membrane protein n=1 Tax=Seonamhaeicola sediminis TaxID=2528206 RepID=A0A562YIN7_9FLAO|nr:RagB/SusD family nutrient uptake outer membrane protein [Seonamhaeicola sediminis]TWO34591.1 RagB/SusD family nutrient uptake outer membrane protein [Seonamhaeicola sediminis]
MKNLIKYIVIIAVFTGVISCDNFLEPIDENRLDYDFISSDPASAEGILLNGYSRLIDQFSFIEAATDDAVNNQLDNDFKRMASGGLNAQFNPASRWNNYESVLWVNKFLEIINAGEILWSPNEEINQMFYMRMEGEALALRALHHFYILQAHAGVGASGQLLGVPYLTEFIEADGDFNTPRLSFEATVQAIMADFDAALALLPTDYSDDPGAVDPIYQQYDFDNYQVVNGSPYNLRISGRIVRALKARLALFAASPSFLNDQSYYTMAASLASELLNTIGGVSGLSSNGVDYFTTYSPSTTDEMIWRGSIPNNVSSGIERRMFPPSVNGRGEVNPTQNFVDAFPMQDGFPATAANGYDPQNPYANRDPRLAQFVVRNGDSFGGGTINTGEGGGIDRLDSIPEFSTTTGYYLKKTLHPSVRLNDDGTAVGQRTYDVYFRYTELFLIFAEAANEIGGPDHQVNGITPRQVIAAIRERAGLDQPDNYLASITSQAAMRELIRNERRLELSFEGHRFWDLRRWGLSLNESAEGYFFNGTNYNSIPSVENRDFPSLYMPIPNDEVLRFPEIEQNAGW